MIKKLLLSVSLILTSILCAAQYNKPYRIAYDEVNKAYLITNRGNGTIVRVDSNYSTSTVITGLTDPRDLAFGSFAGTSGLLVIDDNKIVVYETSGFQRVISYAITPASEIEDIEFDLDNPGYFYLSDPKAGRILKGKVGNPPFYTPTYKVLATGLNNPKGMHYDSKGRLLVVSDTASGQIFQIDTSSGKSTTLFTTGLDNLNHIVEDGEGNFFVTTWGDSYLYRLDSKLDSLTKLTSYNKPAGMFLNAETDLLLLVCHLCNKLEFHKLHYFEPKSDIFSCAGDSASVQFDVSAKSIGTYNSGNKFLIELSDAKGEFNKPLTIGSMDTLNQPNSIEAFIPKSMSGNLKYRVKSTNPSFYSTVKSFTVYKTPNLSGTLPDTLFACEGSTIQFPGTSNTAFDYRWTPGTHLTDSTQLNTEFLAKSSGYFKYDLKAENEQFGCSDSIQTLVEVAEQIKLNNWKRNVSICQGDSVQIGQAQTNLNFRWSPFVAINDSALSNPTFTGTSDQKYFVKVEDPISGCQGLDSLNVSVEDLPVLSIPQRSVDVCAGSTVTLEIDALAGDKYLWSPSENLSDTSGASVDFISNSSGIYSTFIKATNPKGCHVIDSISILNHELPEVVSFSVTGDTSEVRIQYAANNATKTLVFWETSLGVYSQLASLSSLDTILSLEEDIEGPKNFYLQLSNDEGCEALSDTIETSIIRVGISSTRAQRIKIYPNPAQDIIRLDPISKGNNWDYKIMDLMGREVENGQLETGQDELNVAHLPSGQFILILKNDNQDFYYSPMVILRP